MECHPFYVKIKMPMGSETAPCKRTHSNAPHQPRSEASGEGRVGVGQKGKGNVCSSLLRLLPKTL